MESAPDPVKWLVLDASTLDDIDYSAGFSLSGLLDYLEARHITFALARADSNLSTTLETYGLAQRIGEAHMYGNLIDAVNGFRAEVGEAPAQG